MAWPIDGSQKSVQNFVGVTTGSTITVAQSSADILVVIQAAGTLATLTIAIPADANTSIGQVIRVYSQVAITLLTINGEVTISGAPTSMNAGDNFGLQKSLSNTFTRQI